MLKRFTKLCFDQPVNKYLTACMSTEVSEKWDLFTSVCLERKPVITPSLTTIEIEFQKYLAQVELERSLKSDYEVRNENEKKKAELLKKGETGDVDIDSTQLQTAQDFKDACVEELSKFKFASRETEADKKNDLKSLERQLDKHLVLLTHQEIGKKKYFLPPQGLRQDGETLKQTAERVLKDSIGKDIKVQFFGNAPVGFYKYKYPSAVQKNGVVGAKIFIYFARYIKGNLNEQINYKWLNRIELSNEVPKEYGRSLTKFLIDEDFTENKTV